MCREHKKRGKIRPRGNECLLVSRYTNMGQGMRHADENRNCYIRVCHWPAYSVQVERHGRTRINRIQWFGHTTHCSTREKRCCSQHHEVSTSTHTHRTKRIHWKFVSCSLDARRRDHVRCAFLRAFYLSVSIPLNCFSFRARRKCCKEKRKFTLRASRPHIFMCII